MLNKRQIEQLARNSSIKGIRYYMQRVHEDVDILSGEEKKTDTRGNGKDYRRN